ncbi:hypothetical protein OF001_U400018 [Pseudomonas sp. OF001]|nr:hypothetical protein OF001_U400018 [Pseudomonas sp. OF001]
MTHVMACIDGSPSAAAVCDYAAWASQRLTAPLTFLHVIDRDLYPQAASAWAAASTCWRSWPPSTRSAAILPASRAS